MTDRADIEPTQPTGWRRLSYTYHCGWVDWGHALPDGALGLLNKLKGQTADNGLLNSVDVTLNGKPAFVIGYGQEMGALGIRVSARRHWVIQKGLSQAELESVGLAIYLSASFDFEKLQGTFPFSLVSGGSSFSTEDLVSNVIGFYSAARAISQDRMRRLCGEVPVDESYRIWDEHTPDGFSGYQNRTTTPILFPTQYVPAGAENPVFPSALSSIKLAKQGETWARLKSRFLDPGFVNGRVPIEVLPDGSVRVRNGTARPSRVTP
ncbi:hypothetical protein [Marinobacter sp. LN3S78]|uniref:hypothetical protein n=1 Tax=Marinobacter sp. LN3S78 TaxID=3382300 RepID=UPI00387B1D88